MDVHVPIAITSGLRQRGFDVLTCADDGTNRFTDEELLKRATHLNRILFTQDEDFLELAARWQAEESQFFGIIYCHQLAAGIGKIITDIALIAEVLEADELSRGAIYLPL